MQSPNMADCRPANNAVLLSKAANMGCDSVPTGLTKSPVFRGLFILLGESAAGDRI